jgi:hypothetical protein
LEELATAVTEQLMQTHLDLEGWVAVLLVSGQVALFDERHSLVRCFRGEDVAEGHVFEAKVLADVVVVGDVDASRNPIDVRRVGLEVLD